jgi:DNA polymerase III delta subunit
MPTKPSSQVYIFYGEDDFSLLKKIDRWKEEFAKKFSQQGVVIIDGETLAYEQLLQNLDQVAAPSLFASKKLVVCKECLPTKATQEELGERILKLIEANDPNAFYVFYSSKKLDKRLGMIKKILGSGANQTEFALPHGNMLNGWIKAYAKQLNLSMDDAAINKLAVYLGRDLYEEKKFGGRTAEIKEAFDLWTAHSELEKLAAHGATATAGDVEKLVIPKISENVFDLSDTIFGKNKKRAMELLENLFADQSSDEKATAIKIVSLLSEQVRALLLVMILKTQKLDNDAIAETLGWSSGRVFMVSKQMNTVKSDQLRKMIQELLKIDLKLKSSDVNPKLLVDSFVSSFA